MSKNHRVFVSFAIENSNLRDFLVGQARNKGTPFSFTDLSVKQPWNSAWQTNCRTKIRGCDGAIGIITNYTPRADGQIWELKCAAEEGIPTLLIYGYPDQRPSNLPEPIRGRRILTWTWDNIAVFLNHL